MPEDVVIPVLGYPHVSAARDWLIDAFGFTFRWQVDDHRAQLGIGSSSAIAITSGEVAAGVHDHLMIRVDDVDSHRTRAMTCGAAVSELESFPYGERQYTATDPFGRRWVFTQSITDLEPHEWGATEVAI